MKTRLIYLYILIVFLIAGSYIIKQGERFGVSKYKNSKNMELALKSAYGFGYEDCRMHRPEDWENGGEE